MARVQQRIFPKISSVGVMEGNVWFDALEGAEFTYGELALVKKQYIVNSQTSEFAVLFTIDDGVNSSAYLYTGKNGVRKTTLQELKDLGYKDYK